MAEPPLVPPPALAGVEIAVRPDLPHAGRPSRPLGSREAFTNPVCDRGADPWVLRWNAAYYYCRSVAGSIRVGRSERLQEVFRAPSPVVWTPPRRSECSRHLWAPELHRLDGRFYIYVAADDGCNRNHRMYVLEGDATDPCRPFRLKGRIADPADRWAIDGTVLVMDDGRKYFVWSGWEGTRDVGQSLYVAPMSDPWTISGPRVRISAPEASWERNGGLPVNEGPSVLRNRNGQVFLVFSASGSWTDDYCLGLLELVGDDPLRPESWAKRPGPVFTRSTQVHGPGHACFVGSPDGTEDWIVYHAARHGGAGWNRNLRMQRFGWKPDGSPDFGVPVPAGVTLAAPSAVFSRPAASAVVGLVSPYPPR